MMTESFQVKLQPESSQTVILREFNPSLLQIDSDRSTQNMLNDSILHTHLPNWWVTEFEEKSSAWLLTIPELELNQWLMLCANKITQKDFFALQVLASLSMHTTFFSEGSENCDCVMQKWQWIKLNRSRRLWMANWLPGDCHLVDRRMCQKRSNSLSCNHNQQNLKLNLKRTPWSRQCTWWGKDQSDIWWNTKRWKTFVSLPWKSFLLQLLPQHASMDQTITRLTWVACLICKTTTIETWQATQKDLSACMAMKEGSITMCCATRSSAHLLLALISSTSRDSFSSPPRTKVRPAVRNLCSNPKLHGGLVTFWCLRILAK